MDRIISHKSYPKGQDWWPWIWPMTVTFGVLKDQYSGQSFSYCSPPLGEICKKSDTQVYLSFKPIFPPNQSSCICNVETCIAEKQKWMRMNLLKLNDDKPEFILTGTCQQLDEIRGPKVYIGTSMIYPVKSVWNLGFDQDSELKNTPQINKLCSTIAQQLRKFARFGNHKERKLPRS